jgi:dTDP-4-dehydrorhamnose 3,5-epimerase-like enzyme
MSERDPKELIIRRSWWHGYQNIGTEEALVLTWITQPYNPDDEERLSPDAVDISWERVAR